MSVIEKALEVIVKTCIGQKDSKGKPYIIHLLRDILQKKTDLEIVDRLLELIPVSIKTKITDSKLETQYEELISKMSLVGSTRLEQAILLSLRHHMGQKDKGGTSYIIHPLRVMLSLETESEMVVGVLHDTLEDTDITLEELLGIGVTEEEIFALQCLTRLEGETYDEFIYRVLQSDLAVRVKKKDIKENLDISRIPDMDIKKFSLKKRYDRALEILEGAGVEWFYGPSVASRGKCSWFKVIVAKKPDESLYEI